jgi:hypothetical protein
MSKLVTAVGESKANFEEFTGSLHSVEPVAAAAGLSLDDVYGSLARITQSGTSADQATQNMADAIRHLQGPTDVQAARWRSSASVRGREQKLSSSAASRARCNTCPTRSAIRWTRRAILGVVCSTRTRRPPQNAAGMIADVAGCGSHGAGVRERHHLAQGLHRRHQVVQLHRRRAAAAVRRARNKLDGFSKQYKNGRSLSKPTARQ